LTCWYQALLVLAWFRNQGDVALVGAGFGVSRATAYRYRDEVITVLAARAPDLHEALEQVAEQGWSHVVLDGKVFRTDRTRPDRGDHDQRERHTDQLLVFRQEPRFGGNIQAIMRPDGLPIWVSDVVPGHRHDMAAARAVGVLGALYWAASQLGLITLADGGYGGAGQGIRIPIKQPIDGQTLAADNQAYNSLLRSVRCRASVASPCSPAAGGHFVGSPPVPAESATT
jgi:hypothetical protein